MSLPKKTKGIIYWVTANVTDIHVIDDLEFEMLIKLVWEYNVTKNKRMQVLELRRTYAKYKK